MTGDPLIQRDDDREEVVRKRLDVYHSQTEALVGFYSDLAKSGDKTAPQYRAISGLGAIDAITARVFEALRVIPHLRRQRSKPEAPASGFSEGPALHPLPEGMIEAFLQ